MAIRNYLQITTKQGLKELVKALTLILKEIENRVALGGKCSSWTNISAGDPQSSILDFCLIYINILSSTP